MLPFRQSMKRWQQERDVMFLLSLDDGGGMFARGREIDAVIGTLDLGESLRATTHRTNRLVQSRTRATRLTCTADRTGHLVSFDYNSRNFSQKFCGISLAPRRRCECQHRCREEH